MGHTIEPAASGRAACRGCGGKIAKGELRLGERLPNPFADEGDMTLWFHLRCGAFKRPQVLLDAVAEAQVTIEGRESLEAEARCGLEHRRLPRIDGAERASTGRARCRDCRESIAKGTWRIRIVFYEDGRFSPGGFVHVGCARTYFGTTAILERLTCFGGSLGGEEVGELAKLLEG